MVSQRLVLNGFGKEALEVRAASKARSFSSLSSFGDRSY
jgi:hypothetical protein